jgi:ABC-2 type transport system permease protein
MNSLIGKLGAIFLKDLVNNASYRLSFLFQFVAPLFMLLSFFFLSRLLDGAELEGLQRYGDDYFSFAMLGIVFTTYTGIFLTTISATIRMGQTTGTLELIMSTRTSLPTYLLGASLFAFLRATLTIVLFLVVGIFAFGVDFQGANLLGGLLILLFSMAVMVGLGILSGSFILVFKQGDPIGLIVNSGAFLLSGVVYPVAVLPGWLQVGSRLLPQTYALEALRQAVLLGAPLNQLGAQLLPLLLFGAAIIGTGLLAFKYATYRARLEGSFAHY